MATNRISLHCVRFAAEQGHKKEKLRAKKKDEEYEGSTSLEDYEKRARSSSVSSETLASHLINAFVNRQTRCGEWYLMVTRSRLVGSERRFRSGGGGIVGS